MQKLNKLHSELEDFQVIVTFINQPMYTHPVIPVFLLHGVGVEEADDCANSCLPVLFMNVTKQEQRDKHVQVVEVIKLPDAEGFSLQEALQNTRVHSDIWDWIIQKYISLQFISKTSV